MAEITKIVVPEGLGNATADDVAEGVTFTSDNGIRQVGMYKGLDTSDATSTAEDILEGKTAYVNGELITGTLVPLDTSNATATAADIAKGKTAYANGALVTGTNAQAGYTKKTVKLSNNPNGVGLTAYPFASLRTKSTGSTASAITVGINDNFYLYAGARGGSAEHTWTVSVSYS